MSVTRMFVVFLLLFSVTQTVDGETTKTSPARHLLQYKFKPGEIVRSKVVHQAAVKTTIEGTTQTAETVSVSVKAWKVTGVDDAGHITFIHSVEYVDMKNDVSGRETVRYDSRQDKQTPPEFGDVAKRVGVPLSEIVMDRTGKILRREDKAPGSPPPSQLTMPLPKEAIAVGNVWHFPSDFKIKLRGGTVKSIKARQRFELQSVEDGIAKIKVATQILTPVHNPEVEAQLVQRESEGTVRFDIQAGRVLGQQIDLDRRVVGYPNPKSSMHYRTRFVETLLKPTERTATKPKKSR